MRRLFILLIALALLLAACGNQPAETDPTQTAQTLSGEQVSTVGIALPDRETPRWLTDGAALAQGLAALGIQAAVEYAEGDPVLQAEQIGQMIDRKVDCLVVAAVDALMLTQTINRAQSEGIPVIAYDRLLMNTNGVTGCVAWDVGATGVSIGQYIVAKKQLETAQAENRSYTIEFFMGVPEDHNSLLFHLGLMQVLQPYLDMGVLVCNSGRLSFEDTCIQSGTEKQAVETCENIIDQFYVEAMPDILCAATDTLAGGCAIALEKAGCTQELWPLITGYGSEEAAVARIVSGKQAVTTLADSQWLTDTCCALVKQALAGEAFRQEQTIHNGNAQIPAYLGEMVLIDAENYQE